MFRLGLLIWLFIVLIFSPVYAQSQSEIDGCISDLKSFYNKMVSYQHEAASEHPSLYTDQAGELYLLNDISRAYLNYSLFLIDELEWLAGNINKQEVKKHVKNRLAKFNEEGNYYKEYLDLRMKQIKNVEMITHLKYLRRDIEDMHSKIKVFEENLK